LGRWREAVLYYQRHLNICREFGNCQREAAALNNIGRAYQALGCWQDAINCHQQSRRDRSEVQ